MSTDEKKDLTGKVAMHESQVEHVVPPRVLSGQRATKEMILFSIYIALAGWIFNFDLGNKGSPRYICSAVRPGLTNTI